MAGTNAYAAPAKLIELLTAEFASEGTEYGVSFGGEPKTLRRRHIWGGRVAGPHDTFAMRGGSVRRPREETLMWELHLRVALPGKTKQQNAAAAVETGGRVEDVLAAAEVQSGAGVAGCKQIGTVGFAMETSGDDDSPITDITYTVRIHSVLI